jgi:hypothetical protein
MGSGGTSGQSQFSQGYFLKIRLFLPEAVSPVSNGHAAIPGTSGSELAMGVYLRETPCFPDELPRENGANGEVWRRIESPNTGRM